jgi:predicted TIM-barrel fold metal-dependent hydrolase
MASVDCHLHVNFNAFPLGDLIKYLDRERIDCCWLLSWEEINPGPWIYRHLPVEDIYGAYLKYPSRIIPFYAPDPHGDDASVKLDNWHMKGIRGCGELKATLNWDSKQVMAILQTARRLKMPVVFHMEESGIRIPYSDKLFDRLLYYGLETEKKVYKIPQSILRLLVKSYTPLRNRTKSFVFPGYMLDMASLERTLSEYPDVNFVAHGPMFWKHISADGATCSEGYPTGLVTGEGIIWRLLSDYPNLYADTSAGSGLNAFTRDPENAKRFLSLFESKILYGTDNVMKGQREFLNSLRLPKGTCQKICGDNAYGLVNI